MKVLRKKITVPCVHTEPAKHIRHISIITTNIVISLTFDPSSPLTTAPTLNVKIRVLATSYS